MGRVEKGGREEVSVKVERVREMREGELERGKKAQT